MRGKDPNCRSVHGGYPESLTSSQRLELLISVAHAYGSDLPKAVKMLIAIRIGQVVALALCVVYCYKGRAKVSAPVEVL